MEEGLGAGFWFKMIGLIILGGIGAMAIFLLINRSFYRWGAIGTLIFCFVVLGVISYIFDRRSQKRYEAEAEL